MLARACANLIGRVGGRLTLRLLLQPTVAAFFAIRAGLRDAQAGRAPYGMLVFNDRFKRRYLLREAWDEIGKVFIAALVIDIVYQLIEFRWIYPGEAVIVASGLAVVPYLLFRGTANRIARRHEAAKLR